MKTYIDLIINYSFNIICFVFFDMWRLIPISKLILIFINTTIYYLWLYALTTLYISFNNNISFVYKSFTHISFPASATYSTITLLNQYSFLIFIFFHQTFFCLLPPNYYNSIITSLLNTMWYPSILLISNLHNFPLYNINSPNPFSFLLIIFTMTSIHITSNK